RVGGAMDEEIRHHLACDIADRIARGESPAAARLAALRDFGGVEHVKEASRDARGLRGVEDFLADLRYALRLGRRHPIHAAAVIATFGLGVAAAGAIFTFAYGVLLRPLPYARPDRLVAVWERDTRRHQDRNVVSVEAFEAWRDRQRSFDGLAALVPRPVTLTS